MKAQSQDLPPYTVKPYTERRAIQDAGEDDIIRQAFAILKSRVIDRQAFHTPDAVKQFLVIRNAAEQDQYVERFSVLFLDSQSKAIEIETMFTGTLGQTSVYPREVVRRALHHNAAAVVLSHNHPSGSVQPSRADEHLTKSLKDALAMVEVRVLDHIIVNSAGESLSMAESGLI